MILRLENIISGKSFKNLYKLYKNDIKKQLSNYEKELKEVSKSDTFFSSHRKQYIQNQINILKAMENKTSMAIDKKCFFKNLEKIKQACLEILASGKDIDLTIDNDSSLKNIQSDFEFYAYTNQEIEAIISLNNILKENGMTQNIYLFDDCIKTERNKAWDLETVLMTNNEIDIVCNYIKEKEFSPFEAMLFIHRYITSTFRYNYDSEIGNLHSNSNIIGAYKYGKIVCSGFSSLTKAIIDKLQYPELKCEIVSCALLQNDKFEKHAHCLIHIQDKKYDISGSYMNDACWDCEKENINDETRNKEILGEGFAHCMFSVENLMKLKYYDAENFEYKPWRYFHSFDKSKNRSLVTKYKDDELLEQSKNPNYIPDIVKKYKDSSRPISKENYLRAMSRVLTRSLSEKSVEEQKATAKELIIRTSSSFHSTFNSSAKHSLINDGK